MKKDAIMTVDPLELPVDAALPMPGSKSHANRAIIAACLARGTTVLTNATPCDDVVLLVKNIQKMGFRVEWMDRTRGIVKIVGGMPSKIGHATLDCVLAGTTLRFLTALCAVTPGEWIVTGNERMRQRPIGDLTAALRSLGADIEDSNGCPPLRISGKALLGGNVTLDASKSSQFLSALLLIAPSIKNGLTVTLSSDPTSVDYITLTRKVMRDFGVNVDRRQNTFRVPVSEYSPPSVRYAVEGDWSAAGAFLVLRVLTGSSIALPNLEPFSAQADAKLPSIIQTLRGNGRRVIDCSGFPDQVMNIAVLAARRKGETILTGARNLRIKETDRLAVITRELRKTGIRIDERPDGLCIRHSPKLRSATLDPHDDHRMAMAFAILGCMHPGIKIMDPNCVRKSYPNFWKDLKKLHTSPRCIAIVGMRGVGKSTLGKTFARTLGLRHIDTDAVFSSTYGKMQSVSHRGAQHAMHGNIHDILRRRGWTFFRQKEEEIVRAHLQPGIVLSLGGGSIESAETRTALKKSAIIVWMRESTGTVIARLRKLHRPALTDLPLEKEVPLILKRRTPLYAALADITLPPSLPKKSQVAALRSTLRASCSW